ncbi:MAG: antA/AntB antirepressor family protein [Clostridia bacterium]
MEKVLTIFDHSSESMVSGRDLHEFLQVTTPYRIWFPRMCEYGFEQGVDFNPYKNVRVQAEGRRTVSREVDDHRCTVSMAKEISMLQRTTRGQQARRYLLAIERSWNSPESVLMRAFKLNSRSAQLNDLIKLYQAKHKRLALENEELRKKGRYYDALVDTGLATTFRETAKELGVGERALPRLLLDMKFLYRDRRGRLMPYAPNDGRLFWVREYYNSQTACVGVCTYVTPAGRETLLPVIERYLKGGQHDGSESASRHPEL